MVHKNNCAANMKSANVQKSVAKKTLHTRHVGNCTCCDDDSLMQPWSVASVHVHAFGLLNERGG